MVKDIHTFSNDQSGYSRWPLLSSLLNSVSSRLEIDFTGHRRRVMPAPSLLLANIQEFESTFLLILLHIYIFLSRIAVQARHFFCKSDQLSALAS